LPGHVEVFALAITAEALPAQLNVAGYAASSNLEVHQADQHSTCCCGDKGHLPLVRPDEDHADHEGDADQHGDLHRQATQAGGLRGTTNGVRPNLMGFSHDFLLSWL